MIAGIKVIYSRLSDKADAVIKRIISSDRREWIVVSSDKDIASHAWSSGSIPISAGDFLIALEKKVMTPNCYEGGYDEEYSEPQRNGNPRRQEDSRELVERNRLSRQKASKI